jgi:phosphoribosylaminoimidazole-succinocarboxamide synthase
MAEAPDGLTHLHSGKVRELFRAADGRLVMLATDRISAFDHVLASEIPDKGRVLTAMSVWWFAQLAGTVPNHLLGTDDGLLPADWRGRALVVAPLRMLPVEAVARGYLTGSGFAEYGQHGTVCGIRLPHGLEDGAKLPEPIFTPATKAERGAHDENISFTQLAAAIGEQTAAQIEELTLAVYTRAAGIAGERGIILADTKLEFGRTAAGEIVLGDEVLTPDSSRFWPADDYRPGRPQPSFDKQFVRDWLTSPASGWDRRGGAEPPPLPDDVVAATRARYIEAYERLTGLRFSDWPG